MRIAVVHSFYSSQLPSGENTVVESYVKGLISLGHEVLLLAALTDDLRHNFAYSIRSGLRVATGFGTGFESEIASFKPDIVHVHNLFPNLGTRWLKKVEAPVVVTLHNFRSFCANGLFFRDGHNCFECQEISPWRSLKFSCYHDSRIATLPLTLSNILQTPQNTLFDAATVLIVPSRHVQDIFERFGAPKEKLVVIPHGVDAPSAVATSKPHRKWLFVGRFTSEKGLAQLIDCWPDSELLDIIGGSRDEFSAEVISNKINFLGRKTKAEIESLLPNYMGLIFPSQCLETQGLVVLEALSAGVPVVALEGNAGADLVSHHLTGATYHDADTLLKALDEIDSAWELLNRNCLVTFNACFGRSEWLNRQIELFDRIDF